nr:zinc finger CCHC domain-containing protein 8-like [Tanacetum cinerariifolium]
KFDGLRPGVLDPETRKLLGLAEADPPPWLNRMREMGYPPGYLDAEDEDRPSGIEIFGEEVVVVAAVKQETEDGEILDMDISPPHDTAIQTPKSEPPKKMSVQFPGVNAPIPENADEWREKVDGKEPLPGSTPGGPSSL